MPFGAELTDDGVRFRLWAPAAEKVDIQLEGPGAHKRIPMQAVGAGWFESITRSADAGTLYRYRVDDDVAVPDPASRFQPHDVLGPSAVVDPAAHVWTQTDWRGRPWHETVLYELHVGTFSSEGTFDGVRRHLDHLAGLGVTAVELMPVADFAGRWNWGYDGVLPFAPDSAYGSPEQLKLLIDEAHSRNLMVFLDVVYNHFGPEGNFLHTYAPQFFTDRFHTPWGAAIDFSRREVRDFFIHNALYWLQEFRFDGLRLDAVHAIKDDGSPNFLEELADTIHRRIGEDRHVHLVLENEDNTARYLERGEDGRPKRFAAQWNDDFHHALHVLATGEVTGYYEDYADRPIDQLGRCLSEGFAFQGEPLRHRHGRPRGEPSGHLPSTAFVSFLQNHDHIGNRAFGERLTVLVDQRALKTLMVIQLLAPCTPLLFMGEEWGAKQPFFFFCEFQGELADNVRNGRRREFARFPEFQNEETRNSIPDPNAEKTFRASQLDWSCAAVEPHAGWLNMYRELLHLRQREIVPRLRGLRGNAATSRRFDQGGLSVAWRLGDGCTLTLLANLAGSDAVMLPKVPEGGRLLYATHSELPEGAELKRLMPWCAAWFLVDD